MNRTMGKRNESQNGNGSSAKLSKAEKHECLLEMITSLSCVEFTGYIKVNFSQGGIGRIEKFEEIALNRRIAEE
jgi:hypothetical protein